MKRRSEILGEVKEDLKYIPRGVRGSTQNYFRQMYSAVRMRDVAKTSKTREETFKEVWNHWKKVDPNFIPSYDHTYFKIVP